MANHEACQVYLEQQIDEGLKDGKKPYAIGKEISVWVEKLFEAKIPHRTIEQCARRKNATNVAKQVPQNNVTMGGGVTTRPNERKKDDAFKAAAKKMEKAVRDAKRSKYESTSKETILQHINAIKNIVDPPKKLTKRQQALQEKFWKADEVSAERAAFHVMNLKIVPEMHVGDSLSTVDKIISLGGKTYLSVRVTIEKARQ